MNISSGLTRISVPDSGAYASMKGAIEVLTRYMAKELGSRGITANVVAPGAISTDFSGGVVPTVHIAQMTALGRVGQPDDGPRPADDRHDLAVPDRERDLEKRTTKQIAAAP